MSSQAISTIRKYADQIVAQRAVAAEHAASGDAAAADDDIVDAAVADAIRDAGGDASDPMVWSAFQSVLLATIDMPEEPATLVELARFMAAQPAIRTYAGPDGERYTIPED